MNISTHPGEIRVRSIGKFSELDPAVLTYLKLSVSAGKGHTGFPSAADEFLERPIDFNDLIVNPTFTYAMRASGESIKEAGFTDGCILAVDTKIPEFNNCYVVACVNNDLIVKQWVEDEGRVFLCPANEHLNLQPVELTPETEYHKWGVVIFGINISHPAIERRISGL